MSFLQFLYAYIYTSPHSYVSICNYTLILLDVIICISRHLIVFDISACAYTFLSGYVSTFIYLCIWGLQYF